MYQYEGLFIGFSFALPTFIYAASSTFIYRMTQRIRKSGVLFLGYLALSTAMILTGPSLFLGLPESVILTMLGLCILGLGCGMIVIPVLPDMIEAIEESNPTIDMDTLHNKISGLFIAA